MIQHAPPPPSGAEVETDEVAKPWFKKWWGIALIVAGIFVVFGALVDDDDEPDGEEAAEQEVEQPDGVEVELPDVEGDALDEARAALDALDVDVDEVDADDDRAILNPGNWQVESQSPAPGETVEADTTVTLTVFRPEDREAEAAERDEADESADVGDEPETPDNGDEPDEGDNDTDWAEVYDPMEVDADTFVERWNDAIADSGGLGYSLEPLVFDQDPYLNQFPAARQETEDGWAEVHVADHPDSGLLHAELIAEPASEGQGADTIMMMYALIHSVTDLDIDESIELAEEELGLTEEQMDPSDHLEEAEADGVIFELDAMGGTWVLYATRPTDAN